MTKNLFHYQANLTSKELGTALASLVGVGPICGFSTAEIVIDTQQSLVNLTSVGGDLLKRYSSIQQGEYPIKNICITKDGIVYVSDQDTIQVPIVNSFDTSNTNTYNEVIVLAKHTRIEEPIDNPVVFEAYLNPSSSFSFKEYYNNSIKAFSDNFIIGEDLPENDGEYSFTSLEDKVRSLLTTHFDDSSIIIGVYGNDFSIVPYNSIWPTPINYTAYTDSLLKGGLSIFNEFFKGIGTNTLKGYMDAYSNKLADRLYKEIRLKILPAGTIILWSGTRETIPEGWQEYTPASGRYVMGNATNIRLGNTPILDDIGETFDDTGWSNFQINISANNLPRHYHALGVKGTRVKNEGEEDPMPASYSKSSGMPTGGSETEWNERGVNRTTGYILSSPNYTLSSMRDEDSILSQAGQGIQNKETLTLNMIPPTVSLIYIIKLPEVLE